MISNENKELSGEDSEKLCKSHNDTAVEGKKLRLYACRNERFLKKYHPLKQKKVKLQKLKFVPDEVVNERKIGEKYSDKGKSLPSIFTRKYSLLRIAKENSQEINSRDEVFQWLTSIGVEIKKLSATKYVLENRVCLFNNVLIFANRKRVEMELPPFYLSSVLDV